MPENIDEMIEKIKNNNADENRRLAENLKNNLSPEQKSSLDRLMNDSNLMQKLMSNSKVQGIMKKLGGDSNGHK